MSIACRRALGSLRRRARGIVPARRHQSNASSSQLYNLDSFCAAADNTLIRSLTEEPGELDPRTPREVLEAHYVLVNPEPVEEPVLIAGSRACAEKLGLDPDAVGSAEFLNVFSGNALPGALRGWATVYGCHCGGQWFGQLGDGRAVSIGETVHPTTGERHELQLKGSGRTPFSRVFDGRAVVRSSVREFLASEAMASLGVPTTRALSLIAHDGDITRAWYSDADGWEAKRSNMKPTSVNPHPPQQLTVERGAVLCRTGASFIRFAQLELFWRRGDDTRLLQLINHALEREFPDILNSAGSVEADGAKGDMYVAMFREIASRQARLVSEWLRVGYVQGNMNSDNTLLGGRTLDYGPFGFVEEYSPGWTPFTSDPAANFGFRNQPRAAMVNISVLAEVFKRAVSAAAGEGADDDAPSAHVARQLQHITDTVSGFPDTFGREYNEIRRRKLGLVAWNEQASGLWERLDNIMANGGVDYTIFFRQLASASGGDEGLACISPALYAPPIDVGAWEQWLSDLALHVKSEGLCPAERASLMNATNPKYILRNWMAVRAYEAAERNDDFSLVRELHGVLSRPYDEQGVECDEKWYRKTPDWAMAMPGVAYMS